MLWAEASFTIIGLVVALKGTQLFGVINQIRGFLFFCFDWLFSGNFGCRIVISAGGQSGIIHLGNEWKLCLTR